MNNSRGIFGRMSGLHGMTDMSLKQLIVWGDHLKVDQVHIDAQHEAIFNIAVEVADTWHQHGNLTQLKILTEKLAKVLEAHFRYEEEQLEEVRYPKLEEHKSEHAMMLEELQALRNRLEQMKSESAQMAPGFLLHNFVLGVTIGHICHSDMEYCVYARKAAEDKQSVWAVSATKSVVSPQET